jgi:hypothetical protein
MREIAEADSIARAAMALIREAVETCDPATHHCCTMG